MELIAKCARFLKTIIPLDLKSYIKKSCITVLGNQRENGINSFKSRN